jgi:hypothetical protein
MELIGLLIAVGITSLIAFLYKLKMKSKLSEGLGRPVEDHEVTSITSWMKATPDRKDNYKKYVPAKNHPVAPEPQTKSEETF